MHILFDVGATNTRVAVTKTGKKIEEVRIIKTGQNYKDGLFVLAELAKSLTQGRKINRAVGGVPGPLDAKKSKMTSGNLADWRNKPLQKDLARLLDCPVRLENDAALAALGEAHFGAGRNQGVVGYLTFSSGVGGAKVVDGQLDEGDFGYEPYRQVVSGTPSQPATLGSLIAGMNLERNYGAVGSKLNDKRAWTEIERYMAIGIANAALFWSAKTMIINGPVFFNKHISLARINTFLKQHLERLAVTPQAKAAKLKDLSGVYGALTLLHSK